MIGKTLRRDDYKSLLAAQAELEALFEAGSPRREIGRIIDLMAEMFSANVPSEDALAQWFKLLEVYPVEALKDGGRAILRTHRWRNLPLPGDFTLQIEQGPVYRAMRDEQIVYRLLRHAIETHNP